jgi:RNA polymerase sigma-70 factor (ECF subfamily)
MSCYVGYVVTCQLDHFFDVTDLFWILRRIGYMNIAINTVDRLYGDGENALVVAPKTLPSPEHPKAELHRQYKRMTATPEMNLLLVEIASSRDKDAFASLFEHFAPRLKSMLLGLGTDADTAEEIAQEAMLSVWRKAEMYDPEKASASTWIFTIARNLRIDRFRNEKRPELDPNDPSLVPKAEVMADEQLSAKDQQIQVRAALAELPDNQRDVVSLSFVEGLSHQEIADHLELPLGTVKSRLRLSFEKLRTILRSEI